MKRQAAVKYVIDTHSVTERRACRVLSVNRTAYRYEPIRLPDEDDIRADIIYKACNFGRVGYRMVTNMMRNEGVRINHKRVERIWREEGLKLPKKQTKKRRLWLTDGNCVRLRPQHKNHVWSYDFVEDKTVNGKKIRFLNIIDEFTHECLASIPRRSWRNNDIIEVLSGLMITRGCPEYLRSDNGSEFTANVLRQWLSSVGVITAYIEPGSPGLTFSVTGELHVHHIPAGHGAVDGARISGNERLAAAFAETDAPRFVGEHFSKTDIDAALERVESLDPFCGSVFGGIGHFCVAGSEVKCFMVLMLLKLHVKLQAVDPVPLDLLTV